MRKQAIEKAIDHSFKQTCVNMVNFIVYILQLDDDWPSCHNRVNPVIVTLAIL